MAIFYEFELLNGSTVSIDLSSVVSFGAHSQLSYATSIILDNGKEFGVKPSYEETREILKLAGTHEWRRTPAQR